MIKSLLTVCIDEFDYWTFPGGSSGATMYSAIQAMKDFGLKPGQRCVVIFPDSVRNYM